MKLTRIRILTSLLVVTVLLGSAVAADHTASFSTGKADLKSAGALAFGPDGILFVGDSLGAAVYALDTGDHKAGAAGKINVAAINEKVAALLGAAPDQVLINDMAVNPATKRAYLSVSRGRGPDAAPVILRTGASGKLEELPLDNIKHTKVMLPNAPGPEEKDRRGNLRRMESITDLHYVDGKVFVAGLTNEEFSSNLRAIPFPFEAAPNGASVEIFHGAHGRWETQSPVRTFVPYEIKAEPHLLAAYTCTPLVKFPVSALKPGTKVVGTTIAELGNRNRPLDMVIYNKGGKDYILMNNSSRGVMKMSTEKIDQYQAITAQTDVTGLPYETIADLKGVEQLDKLDETNAVILARADSGSLDLKTIALP